MAISSVGKMFVKFILFSNKPLKWKKALQLLQKTDTLFKKYE